MASRRSTLSALSPPRRKNCSRRACLISRRTLRRAMPSLHRWQHCIEPRFISSVHNSVYHSFSWYWVPRNIHVHTSLLFHRPLFCYECEPVFIYYGLRSSRSLHFSISRWHQPRCLFLPFLTALLILPLILILILLTPHLFPHINLLPPYALRLPLPHPNDILPGAPKRNNILCHSLNAPILKRRIKLVLQHLRQHQRDVLRVWQRHIAIAIAIAAVVVKGVDYLRGEPATLFA